MFPTPAIAPRLEASSLFTPADLYQARFTATLYPAQNQNVIAALTALVSLAVREGHVCLHLGHAQTLAHLASLGITNQDLEQLKILAAPDKNGPLVLRGSHLYFARFYHNEITVAQMIQTMVQAEPDLFFLPAQALGPALDENNDPDWQTMAVFAALRSRFCVISGGPGTGKTHTVARILDLLTQIHPHLSIGLAAPTGKAASRMTQALNTAFKDQIPLHLARSIWGQAQTVHRLLGLRPGLSSTYHGKNPLPLDVLIVDEVSMLDLELATRLLEALPRQARLIFLGDRHQLASVEAGGVLANLCQAVEVNHFSEAFEIQWQSITKTTTALPRAKKLRPLTDHVLELQKSWRFAAQSHIAQWATLIRQGRAESGIEFLLEPSQDLTFIPNKGNLTALLAPLIVDAFAPLQQITDPAQALSHFDTLRLLSPVHHGPRGTLALNALVQKIVLGKTIDPTRPWYAGRPIMILENDYSLDLFNGDVGLALPVDGILRVFFAGSDGVRSFIPGRLPRHETCYAMTVHKSQGSEFEHTVLIVPEEPCPVLSRELLYTALTRAKKHFTLCAPINQIRQAILSPVLRDSGLKALLTQGGNHDHTCSTSIRR